MAADDTHLDPRARRTLDALQVALGKHMRTQQLSQISVSEICRTAGVHRTTFYKHFESVADLAGLAVTDLIDRITTFAPEDGEVDDEGRPRTARSYADWLAALVDHVGRRRETYRSILGPKGDPGLQRALSEHLVAKARLALESAAATEEDLAMDITADYGLMLRLLAPKHWPSADDDPRKLANHLLLLAFRRKFCDHGSVVP